MKIMVTGGAGFIGSNLCEELLKRDFQVVVVDNFDEFYSYKTKVRNVYESFGKLDEYRDILAENLIKEKMIDRCSKRFLSDKYKLYYIDIRDKKIEEIFKNEGIDFVINLAGLAGVRPSIERPLDYEDVNIKGYMNILEMCKKYEVKKFIQASSSSVYGNNKKVPFKETDIVDFPISPYAGTKKSGEILGYTYHSLYGIDMFQLRFFTVFGERQREDLAIHKFVKAIKNGSELTMYGDGTTARDYTYVGDIVQGILKSIDYLMKNKGVYEILNLGNSHTVSLKEMIEIIEKVIGKKANILEMPRQNGDVDITFADISKAKEIIGYEPKVTFEEGIRKFVKWYEVM